MENKKRKSNLAATENPLTKAIHATGMVVVCLAFHTFLIFGFDGIAGLVIGALAISIALSFALRQTRTVLLAAYTMATLILLSVGGFFIFMLA